MDMPRIGEKDQAEAKAALKAAIEALLNGGVESVVAVSGRWEVIASRSTMDGYRIHLRC